MGRLKKGIIVELKIREMRLETMKIVIPKEIRFGGLSMMPVKPLATMRKSL